MKKLSILLVFALLLSLFAACGFALPVLPGQPADAAVATAPEQTADATVPTAPDTVSPTAPDAPASTATALPAGDEDIHPMLFRVTGPEGQEGYLFGTIHVGDQRIDTVMDKLTPVLDGCGALAVEFDILAYEKDLTAQIKAAQLYILSDGTKASDHMPAETYEKASALLGEAGLYPTLMQSYNLAMWSQLVEQAALMTRTDYDLEIGMDRSLIQHCYEKQIEVRDVESADFQMELLASFSDELNLLMIESTLDNLDSYGESIDELYAAWLSGDYDRITAVLNEESGEADELTEEETALLEDYYDKMLTQRNLGMRDKAVQWLEAGDKVFFAVGAAHLVDEGGLVELLRAAGYTVEQISY